MSKKNAAETRGQPRKPPERKRTCRLVVCLTAAEYAAIRQRVGGESISAWARARVLAP